MANTILVRRGSGDPTPGSFAHGEPAFNGEELFVKDGSTAMHSIGNRSYVHADRGHVYLTDDDTWFCPIGSLTYGDSETFGDGASPTLDYLQKTAFWVPANTTIKNLIFSGRCGETNLTELRLYVDAISATDAEWRSGMSGVTPTRSALYNDNWYSTSPAMTNNLNLFHMKEIEINTKVTAKSLIVLSIKPTISGSPTNAKFTSNWSFELTGPQRQV